jgi:hypothetical protein
MHFVRNLPEYGRIRNGTPETGIELILDALDIVTRGQGN